MFQCISTIDNKTYIQIGEIEGVRCVRKKVNAEERKFTVQCAKNCRNVVELLGPTANSTSYIYMPQYTTDLFFYLKQQMPLTACQKHIVTVQRYLIQLTEALVDIHELGLVHVDIKPENCLLRDDNLYLCDFEYVNEEGHKNLFGKGTESYRAPETWIKGHRIGQSVDIYSLAVIWYVALTGRFPWLVSDRRCGDYKRFVRHNVLPCQNLLSEECAQMLRNMLDSLSSTRPTAKQMLDYYKSGHDWVFKPPKSEPNDSTSNSTNGRDVKRVRVAYL